MLDLHANVCTPGVGATLTLGVGPGVIAAGDGQTIAGVPIGGEAATLVGWGILTPTADALARIRLQSSDMVDPLNGCDVAVGGAASTLRNFWKYTNLKYKTGQRIIQASTLTGVVDGASLLMDHYPVGTCIAGSRHATNQVVTALATTFAALGANAWGVIPYAPGQPLPNGKYAILGATATAITVAAIRFRHVNFKGFTPGFPIVETAVAIAATFAISQKTSLLVCEDGTQFVYLSEVFGMPCCPVFTVSNAGTGLIIEMIAAQAATPLVTIYLAKVG